MKKSSSHIRELRLFYNFSRYFLLVLLMFGFVAGQTPEYVWVELGIHASPTELPFKDTDSDKKDHKEELEDKDEFETNHHFIHMFEGSSACNFSAKSSDQSVDLFLYTPPPEQLS